MVIERCRVATAGNGGGGTFDSLFHGDDATFDGRDDLFGLGFHVRPGNVGYQRGHVERSDGGFQGYYQQGDHGRDYSLVAALYFRYFLEYLEFRTGVLGVFVKIIVMIFFLTIILLFIQFFIAGIVSKKNPFRLFRNMLPAYMTALGTQSSAATIPVTLEQTIKNGVNRELATFVIPLCATIHLSGSTMKIVACAMAIMLMSGMPISFGVMAGFIFMLGIAMVAAPGVPGGAIMAALGLLQSMLGFDETAQGLMIALYIAMDSFGTACNVTGDGAIAVIMDRINKKSHHTGTREELEEVVVAE